MLFAGGLVCSLLLYIMFIISIRLIIKPTVVVGMHVCIHFFAAIHKAVLGGEGVPAALSL